MLLQSLTGKASGRTLVILIRLQAEAHAHWALIWGAATCVTHTPATHVPLTQSTVVAGNSSRSVGVQCMTLMGRGTAVPWRAAHDQGDGEAECRSHAVLESRSGLFEPVTLYTAKCSDSESHLHERQHLRCNHLSIQPCNLQVHSRQSQDKVTPQRG